MHCFLSGYPAVCLFFCVCAQTYTKALPLFMHFVTVHSSNQIFMFTFPPNYTFELSGLQQFFPLRADFFHVTRNLSWGIMLSIQQLLAWLLQGIDSALVSRQLRFKGLVFLHLALQVGGVLLTGEQRHRISAMEKTRQKRKHHNAQMKKNGRHKYREKTISISFTNYLVSLISSSLHLFIDPALKLIRVPEELLEVEGVLQGSTTRLSTVMQGIAAAE